MNGSQNTEKRFAVRIIRETELLGSQIFTNSTREAVVFGAKFFREDLPYFVELFAEIASQTRYSRRYHGPPIWDGYADTS